VTAPVSVSRAAARRFLLRSFGLERPGGDRGVPDVVRDLEFVQMDSIDVCGRIHDLILWSRIRGYSPGGLSTALYGAPRVAFEEHFPNLAALPLDEYRYFVREMRRRSRSATSRSSGRLTTEERPAARALLDRIGAEGPLRSRDASAGTARTRSAWGTTQTVAARVLEKLWLHGRLAIQRREGFERWFDLPERVLPEEALALHRPGAKLPPPGEESAFHARKRLRSRRLFRPSRLDRAALPRRAFREVSVEGSPRNWWVLAEDLPRLLEAADAAPVARPGVGLLAPLDPLIYDRERTRDLFGFEYVWEVYTPAAKRRWGYYVLPVIWGDRLAGRLDPRMDRASGTLRLVTLQLEPGIDGVEIAPDLAARLRDYARFLGARRIRPEGVGATLLAALAPHLSDLLHLD
jgi:uncharacterized protein